MRHLTIDAPGSAACGRSGLPLVALCGNDHRRLVPFRLLKTGNDDRSSLYGRPFVCKECGNRKVTLFAIESQIELDALRRTQRQVDRPAVAPTNYRKRDPAADLP